MSFIDIIVNIWSAMFELFWFSKKSISNKLSIYVKSYTGRTLSVHLDPKWDIKNVKQVIGPKLGLPPEEVKIIFAGKELDDATVIEECDLGEESVLHAVRSKKKNGGSRPLNEVMSRLDGEREAEERSGRAQFRVYCGYCENVRRGKLRVRCRRCREGALTLDSDPSSWQDVLLPCRISAHCENPRCPDGAMGWSEFYFKCGEHKSGRETEEAVPLNLIRYNHSSVPCLACTDVLDTVLVFDCGHTTCLECFRRYCLCRLRERRFVWSEEDGYTVGCPAGCNDSSVREPHHFRLLDKDEYERYQRFGAEECVLQSGGVLCPRPHCGAGIIPDDDCSKITCSNGCGFVFCRNCLQGYHLGECLSSEEAIGGDSSEYPIDRERAAQAKWDEASKTAIKVMTKPCPKCRTPTERSGGCMHMICTRCSLEWCWVCQVEWTRNCMGEHWFG